MHTVWWTASVTVVVSAMLLTSCTGSGVSDTSSKEAKPYGSLTVVGDYSSGDVDPQLASGQQFYALSAAIFDTLIFVTPEGQAKPGIAERWEISDDGTTHSFYIRKGVKFHDDSDLTGADVKFSIERMLAPQSVNRDAPNWRGAIASVELKDDYTVVLRMKQSRFELLPGYDGGMASVVPKRYIEEKGVEYFRSHLVGSGPWKFVKYDPGTRLELEAVENHWRQVPKFKNVAVLNITEETTKVAMLKTGELDMAQVAPDSVSGIKAAGLRVLSYAGGAQYAMFIFYDVEHPEKYAFGDVRVRKSLQLAINARDMADAMFGGNGGPVSFSHVSPTAYFFDPNVLKPDPFDPEQARKLLADAGYPNGFTTKLWDTGGGGLLSTVGLAISGYWRKVGVNAQTVPVEYGAFYPTFIPKQKPEIWNSAWTFLAREGRDFDPMVTIYHSTKGAPKNHTNRKLDELIDRVPNTKDPAEKKRLALEAAVMAKNEYSTLAVVGLNTNLVLGSKIGEVAPGRLSFVFAVLYERTTHAK